MAGDVIKEFLGKKSLLSDSLILIFYTYSYMRKILCNQQNQNVWRVPENARIELQTNTKSYIEVEQYNNGPHSVHSHSMICTIDMCLLHYYPTTTVAVAAVQNENFLWKNTFNFRSFIYDCDKYY